MWHKYMKQDEKHGVYETWWNSKKDVISNNGWIKCIQRLKNERGDRLILDKDEDVYSMVSKFILGFWKGVHWVVR